MTLNTILLFLIVPIFTWLGSYIYLSRYYKKLNLLHTKIHESKRYTLLETIFYWNHFLRELPINTFYALAISLTLSSFGFSNYSNIPMVFLLAIFLVVVLVGSIRKVGIKNTLLDLFQFRELDEVIEYGSHWRMHFLSTFYLLLILLLPITQLPKPNLELAILILVLFWVVTLLFGIDKKMVTDPRWLLHGAREIVTFFVLVIAPITLFMQYKLLIWPSLNPLFLVISSIILMVTIYISYVYFNSNLKKLAQNNFGFKYLLASHFFEHILDCIYIFLIVSIFLN